MPDAHKSAMQKTKNMKGDKKNLAVIGNLGLLELNKKYNICAY
jgi:hypothetical protein